MKYFLFCLMLILSLTGFAATPPKPLTAGIYSFRNFQVVLKKRYEAVYASSSSGRERMKLLLSQKYNCSNTGREIYLCSAFLPMNDAQSEVSVRVVNSLSPLKIKVQPAFGEASLISEAEALVEWSIPQEVSFHNKVYQSYRYLQTAANTKIFLGTLAEETFLVEPDGTVQYVYPMTVNESKDSYVKYLILGDYGI